ncbi:MAG: arylesterase [Longimicrobiales bacterium]|nr:arylesterase [Longimicrobiales bacterium]
MQVLVIGTSLTAGLGLEDPARQSWAGQLQALADSAGLDVGIRNGGVSGDTSAGGLRRVRWMLRTPVDVLIVELGANDGLRGLGPAALEENLREIVRVARAADPAIEIALVAMEAPPNLGSDYTTAFREVYPRVAQDLSVTLVPFLLEGVAGVAELNQSDGIHPTARGHALMARRAWPVLEPLLRRALAAQAPPSGEEAAA